MTAVDVGCNSCLVNRVVLLFDEDGVVLWFSSFVCLGKDYVLLHYLVLYLCALEEGFEAEFEGRPIGVGNGSARDIEVDRGVEDKVHSEHPMDDLHLRSDGPFLLRLTLSHYFWASQGRGNHCNNGCNIY